MSIINYISAEVLQQEGFIYRADRDSLIRAVVEQCPELARMELSVAQLASGLGVGYHRANWYLKHKGLPQRMTVSQYLETDWSEIKDLHNKGDNKRKRTYIKS